MIVVDASLAAKWLVKEPQSESAGQFLSRYLTQLTAPALIGVEVGGALVRRSNVGEIGPEEAIAALKRWLGLIESGAPGLQPVTSVRLLAAGELAMTLRHPLKDCVYLALAIELACPLATCDARFAARARPLYSDVKLLSDYDFPNTPRRPDV